MIYVDRTKIETPRFFTSTIAKSLRQELERFFHLPAEERRQQRFSLTSIRQNIKRYALNDIHSLFNGNCAYCESNVGIENAIVEAFRPIAGVRDDLGFHQDLYWWLALDWNNLFLACQVCNANKANLFPILGQRGMPEQEIEVLNELEIPALIDPCRVDPWDHINYTEHGAMIPKPSSDLATSTIDLFDLNRHNLIARRDQIGGEIKAAWNTLPHSPSDKEIFDFSKYILDPTYEFSGWRRYYTLTFLDSEKVKDFFNFYSDSKEGRRPVILEPINRSNISMELKGSLTLGDGKSQAIDHGNWLQKIEIENFKTISKISVQLCPKKNPEEAFFHVIIGENAVGKSSILQAIALGLGKENLPSEVTPQAVLRKGQNEGKIYLSFSRGITLEVSFNKQNEDFEYNWDPRPIDLFVAGYGAIRFTETPELKSKTSQPIRLDNVWQPTATLTDPHDYLIRLKNEEDFDLAAAAIKDLLPGKANDYLFVQGDGSVQISFNGENSSFSELSEGYKSVIALATDIMASISNDVSDFKGANGIILIDELGVHLHPRWKMKIVSALRKAFPSVQFITTTHDPLCLVGLHKGEVAVLRKDEDTGDVVLIDGENLPNPSGMRVDQILTSEFFGLNSTLDPKTEVDFNRYYALLAKPHSVRSEEENEELDTLVRDLKERKYLGDSLREEIVYAVLDELIAKSEKSIQREDLKKKTLDSVKDFWGNLDSPEA